MQNYRLIPQIVKAEANPFNSSQPLTDSQGNSHTVPAGWWLVEPAPGQVVMMSSEAFQAAYERDQVYATADGFLETVTDLRGSDFMLAQRALEAEARITSLEGLLSPGGQLNPTSVVEAIMQLRSATATTSAGLEARIASLEALVSAARTALTS